MRARAFVVVDGPAGAGKTLLIERLLRSNRSKLLMVARGVLGVLDDERAKPRASASRRDRELGRYREAGASNVTRYEFPRSVRESDAFFDTRFMEDYSEGVIIEGDSPLGVPPDLAVFVAPPLPDGERLVRRVRVDHSEAHERRLEQLGALVSSPDGGAGVMREMLESELGRALPLPEAALAQARASFAAAFEQAKSAGPPAPTRRWALAEGYRGIERAQVVAVNVRSDAERERAAALLPDLARLRKDPKIFDDVIGWRGKRLPITAVVADLADAKDKGTRQILARIKRAL
jgi:hypothetical protein